MDATGTDRPPDLWHVSEQRIERFVPRPSPPRSSRPGEPLVWAIDEQHLDRQLLPRDCPRVFARWDRRTSTVDGALLGEDAQPGDAVVWIEPTWLARAASTSLHLHRLPAGSFALEDRTAGYWVSREAVVPTGVRRIEDPVTALAARGVPVRTAHDLRALAARVAASSLSFSVIRLHLAAGGGADGDDAGCAR